MTSGLEIGLRPHPLLDVRAFRARFPTPLGEQPEPTAIRAWFGASAGTAPVEVSESVQPAIRALLRHGGFKPTGRNKPASEYLIKAVEEGWLAPDRGINAAVDACNVVSLHSGLPISVIDLGKTRGALFVEVCAAGTSYVFNPSGQVIDVGGLVSLHDADGPCAGPVKDAQRTKTDDQTTETLSVLWSSLALPGQVDRALAWYLELLTSAGAACEIVSLRPL